MPEDIGKRAAGEQGVILHRLHLFLSDFRQRENWHAWFRKSDTNENIPERPRWTRFRGQSAPERTLLTEEMAANTAQFRCREKAYSIRHFACWRAFVYYPRPSGRPGTPGGGRMAFQVDRS